MVEDIQDVGLAERHVVVDQELLVVEMGHNGVVGNVERRRDMEH